MSTTHRVDINADLDALQLQTLIADLAQARAALQPPVPANRPRLDDPQTPERIPVEDQPALEFAALHGGGLRLWVRSTGFGWLAITLNAEQTAALRDYTARMLPGPIGPLFKQGVDQPH